MVPSDFPSTRSFHPLSLLLSDLRYMQTARMAAYCGQLTVFSFAVAVVHGCLLLAVLVGVCGSMSLFSFHSCGRR